MFIRQLEVVDFSPDRGPSRPLSEVTADYIKAAPTAIGMLLVVILGPYVISLALVVSAEAFSFVSSAIRWFFPPKIEEKIRDEIVQEYRKDKERSISLNLDEEKTQDNKKLQAVNTKIEEATATCEKLQRKEVKKCKDNVIAEQGADCRKMQKGEMSRCIVTRIDQRKMITKEVINTCRNECIVKTGKFEQTMQALKECDEEGRRLCTSARYDAKQEAELAYGMYPNMDEFKGYVDARSLKLYWDNGCGTWKSEEECSSWILTNKRWLERKDQIDKKVVDNYREFLAKRKKARANIPTIVQKHFGPNHKRLRIP